ncbi:MAG: LysR family transcriptional regulator [Oceanospirillaceae bacterium]|nr:LysR family transcriptional regulator [Oceanospirillaceae bacterium]
MDTATLQAFVEVARSSSFSNAAQNLFITQSAVSKRIAQLEGQLNTRLFDRIGRSISLTEAGRTLLPQAERILTEFEDARRLLSNLSGEVTGRLSLAASHHISLHRLPNALRRFVKSYPQVEMDLRFYESEVAYDAVMHGEIELALITLSPQSDPRIVAETIWLDRLHYCVAAGHPLAQQRYVEFDQLNDYPAILPGANTFTYQIVHQQLASLGLEPNLGISTNYLDTIRMMVRSGLGWSLLPETLIDSELAQLDTGSQPVERPLGYIYHRERTLSNAARELLAILKKAEQPTCTETLVSGN